MRAGTPNLLGAIAFGVAAEAAGAHLEEESARVAALAARLLERLCVRDSRPPPQSSGAHADIGSAIKLPTLSI